MVHILPSAIWRPISRNYTAQKRKLTRGLVNHVDAGNASTLYHWFNDPRARASSHLFVKLDGTIEQYIDLDLTAWAQQYGDAELISIETQGYGNGQWTKSQIASLIRIWIYCANHYGFPLRQMSSSRASESGIGWHALGVPATAQQKADRISQTGGQLWSSAVGKICPGPGRIKQIPAMISQALELAGTPAPKPTPAPSSKGYGVDVAKVQRQLKQAGYYQGGLVDGDYGRMTKDAVTAYQRAQRYYPGLLVDGEWGKLTQAHYEWVRVLQGALNRWKTSSRIGKTKIDGDFGAFVDRLVRQTISDNFRGAYSRAVKAVYGSRARPVNDGVPGRAFCHMLNIKPHPTA